jgi:bifunctional non-homologous end joining protein LigD
MLPKIAPLELIQRRSAFDDPEWFFEIKHDGFRAVAYIENGTCTLVSRNDNVYMRFGDLGLALADEIEADSAILDGEIIVVGEDGTTRFNDLMANRRPPVFAAFDLMWLDGKDLRDRPLRARKEALFQQIRKGARRTFYVDHVEAAGKAMFAEICARDMEGIVCKPAISPYRPIAGKSPWIKVKNPHYSQAEGRKELFDERHRR